MIEIARQVIETICALDAFAVVLAALFAAWLVWRFASEAP